MKRIPRDKENTAVKPLAVGKNSANISYLLCQYPSLSLILASFLNIRITFVPSYCVSLSSSQLPYPDYSSFETFYMKFSPFLYLSTKSAPNIYRTYIKKTNKSIVCHVSGFVESITQPISCLNYVPPSYLEKLYLENALEDQV